MTHQPEGKPRKDIEEHNTENPDDMLGAMHALFGASIVYADGSLSVLFFSRNGRKPDGGELEDIEWFKVWTMLASRLGNSRTLDPARRDFARNAFDASVRGLGIPDLTRH